MKNGDLFWFKNINNKSANNFLSLKDIKKINILSENKFQFICLKKNYEFLVENKKKRDEWIEVIEKEIKRISKIQKKKYENVFELETKKKVIKDLFNLESIDDNKDYIKLYVEKAFKNENFFKLKSSM